MRLRVVDAAKLVGGTMAATLDRTLGPRSAGSFGILLYHRVAPVPQGVPPPPLNVTPERFRRQLRGLTAAGIKIVTLNDVLARVQAGEDVPPRVAIVTFDDGYDSVYEHAWPVLQELDLPATLFVATAFLDSETPFPFDPWGQAHQRDAPEDTWYPLSWSRCQELARSGLVEIGSHSHTHENFKRRPDQLRVDLCASLATLEQRLGPAPRAFSYPYGSAPDGFADASLRAAAQSTGVTCALTTEIGLVNPAADRFAWARLEASSSDGPRTLVAKVDGWYDWMERPRAWFQRVSH